MSWMDEYKRKRVSAEEAAEAVRPGDRIGMALLTGEPFILVEALYKRKEELKNVVFFKGGEWRGGPFLEPGMEEHFKLNTIFVFPPSFKAISEGRADLTAGHNYMINRWVEDRSIPIDVFMGIVSPPDRHGYFSLGLNIFYSHEMIGAARNVIFEVNDQMPRTCGNTAVHISKVDYVVEHSSPLLKAPKRGALPTEEEKMIGKNVASLIQDGDTIQIGIGSISEAIVSYLEDKKDLGIHTELLPVGIEKLVQKGIVTGNRKILDPGKIVCTYCLPVEGEDEMLNFVTENPMVEFHSMAYTNDPCVIRKNNNMVAILNALEVDLTGQVNTESFGPIQYSGVGGFCDFIRGANMSRGGKAIVVLPSTAKNGKISRIVSQLKTGTVVTSPRTDTNFVVTEYGIAKLAGKTNKERAKELISIAHPDFRDALLREAKELFHL